MRGEWRDNRDRRILLSRHHQRRICARGAPAPGCSSNNAGLETNLMRSGGEEVTVGSLPSRRPPRAGTLPPGAGCHALPWREGSEEADEPIWSVAFELEEGGVEGADTSYRPEQQRQLGEREQESKRVRG